MILTAHQPVYLPWLGLFHKISLSDKFVYFNEVQYLPKDWMNRNKIKTKTGPIWLSVPVLRKGYRDMKTNELKINNSIKMRDFWMPFAPIILSEYQDLLIKNPKNLESPFMTIAFETKDGKNKIPAAVHQADGTARAQLLKKEQNPILWNLIFKFYEKTGVPALLNTSFNLHGEPIVRTVNDGLRVFKKSELEVLWLDNHIIEKNN